MLHLLIFFDLRLTFCLIFPVTFKLKCNFFYICGINTGGKFMLSREKAPTSRLRLQLGSVRLMEINHHHHYSYKPFLMGLGP